MGSTDRGRPGKRARVESEQDAGPSTPATFDLLLYVRWFGPSGQTKVNRLSLRSIESHESLEGLPSALVKGAYPTEVHMPQFVISEEFHKFTPTREYLALPGDVVRTEFRLVIMEGGWEYTVLRRDLGPLSDSQRNLMIACIEFEGAPLLLGELGVRWAMIAYPIVSVKKVFLDGISERLRTDPDGFTGMQL